MKPVVVTLTGPSCAGKSTLEKMLKAEGFAALISSTTRAPRPGEEHGKHYYFLTREEFEAKIAAGGFVEHVEFGGNRYGGEVAEFERQFATGKPVVVVCEPNGRDQIDAYCKRNGWECIKVYVGGRAETIARRFLTRFAEEWDNVNALSVPAIEKLMKSHAGRLAMMLTTEQAWILEAATKSVYTLRLEYFDERNEKDAAGFITSLALTMQASKEKKAA